MGQFSVQIPGQLSVQINKQSLESLCRIINGVRKTGFGVFGIELLENKEIIGWAGINTMPDSSRFELLYALRADYWGKGFATEAGAALVHAAFTELDSPLPEVYALVFPQNILSIRVLEKLGMSLLEYYFDEPSQRHACLYRITRDEFGERGSMRSGFQSSSKK